MKALILQHEESTPPGSTIEWLEKKQIPYEICWPSETTVLPSPESFDLLFICGGSMNVDQEEKFPWLQAEKKLIRDSLAQNKKMVGLCLGGQLIAEALGATVQKHSQFEVGWHLVQMLDRPGSLMVFEWHGYSFSIPPGAKLTSTNANCANQSFTYGSRVLGFQFHPETTEAWAAQCANSPNLPTTGFVQTREEISRDICFQPQLQQWYFAQLNRLA
jgi:GMP synthase-like glutamine amidotransferase